MLGFKASLSLVEMLARLSLLEQTLPFLLHNLGVGKEDAYTGTLGFLPSNFRAA